MTRSTTQPGPRPHLRGPLWVLGISLLVGGALRVGFLLAQPISPYDPWRHRQLVDNLRSGLGFTLFEGQDYLWYNPLWYRLSALLTDGDGMRWVAAAFSLLCVPLAFRALQFELPDRPAAAAWGAALTATLGPLIAFTCHDGSEALAVALVFLALAVNPRRSPWRALLAGVVLGLALVLRLNLLFNGILLLGLLRRPGRGLPFIAGVALPLLAHFARNARILSAEAWVYTWDGLAVRGDSFDLGSTLLLQRHPEIQAALAALHRTIVSLPQWLLRLDWLLFLLLGLGALALCRRWAWRGAALATLAYFFLLDATGSANFFRLYVAIFPAMILGAAVVASEPSRRGLRAGFIALFVLVGLPSLAPTPMTPLPDATAPARLIVHDAYFVNSGRYHPEALLRTYPGRRFVGLPLRGTDLPAFLDAHPTVDRLLWHDFSLQDTVLEAFAVAGWQPEQTELGVDGHRYQVWVRPTR
ncbi:MAG: hypothetical protein OES25_15035 [Acidobacteriota bacterium]|nr:hypothetical protein [Acidobacteriota bacterium]